jgi:phage terminase large subunit-like protein
MGTRGINATPKKRSSAAPPGPLAGTTLKLRPWQKRFIRSVYRTDKRGYRLVRTAVLSVARKNGKTQLAVPCASVPYPGLRPNKEASATRSPALASRPAVWFNEMVAIITKTPWLNDRINIVRFRKELEDQDNGSTFDALSADVAPVHGLSPSFVCYDELAQGAEPRPL